MVLSFRAEDKPKKSDCRGGTPVSVQRKQAHASTYAPQQQQKKGKEARTNKNAHLQLLRTLLSRNGLTHPPAQGRVLERKTAQAVAPNGGLALALHAKLSRWHAASSKR